MNLYDSQVVSITIIDPSWLNRSGSWEVSTSACAVRSVITIRRTWIVTCATSAAKNRVLVVRYALTVHITSLPFKPTSCVVTKIRFAITSSILRKFKYRHFLTIAFWWYFIFSGFIMQSEWFVFRRMSTAKRDIFMCCIIYCKFKDKIFFFYSLILVERTSLLPIPMYAYLKLAMFVNNSSNKRTDSVQVSCNH